MKTKVDPSEVQIKPTTPLGALLSASVEKEARENGEQVVEPPPRKHKARPTDPTLLLASKLDRILAGMESGMRTWALHWLCAKWMNKAPICQAVPLNPQARGEQP